LPGYTSCISAINHERLLRRREELRELALRSREAVLLSAAVGALTGVGVALFDGVTIQAALAHVLRLPTWLQPWLPLVGLTVSALLLRAGGRVTPSTTDEYIREFHSYDDLPLRPLPWRILAAVATLGSGTPGGMEGPSIYIGAGIGTAFQQRFRKVLGPTGSKNLMVAGAAAGVAAIFKAPATGAVFALEVPYRDDLGRRILVPSLIGAASGYLTFVAIEGTEPLFQIQGQPPFDLRDLLGTLGLGVAVGLIIRGYALALRQAKRFQKERSPWLAVPVGGVTIALLAISAQQLTNRPLGLTPGYNAIRWATSPHHSLGVVGLILAIRLGGTVAALAGSGVIGLFVPLVVAGALMGRIAGGALDMPDPTLFLVIGVAAALGAGYRVPLAAVMFVAEATGRPGFVVPGLLAAVGADLVMGNSAVTTYQQSGIAVAEYH
jgi:CIC family chloride channel protein